MKHTDCRVCGASLPAPFLDLGLQPLANNLWNEPEPPTRDLYPLALTQCRACSLIQLTVVVDPHVLFDHYAYLTGVSKGFSAHLKRMADDLVRDMRLPVGALHIDIGGNDGTLCRAFAAHGLDTINVEPAENVAALSARHVTTYHGYFDHRFVEQQRRQARIITATNVFAHVDDPGGLLENVKRILEPGGVFVIEAPNVVTMLQQGTVDLAYHEHLSFWGIDSLTAIAYRHGMGIIDASGNDAHGGSLRVTLRPGEDHWWGGQGYGALDKAVASDPFSWDEAISAFAETAERKRRLIRACLITAGIVGRPIVGFTAPAKATVLANACGLSGILDWCVDDAATKQGKFLPMAKGPGIPILPVDSLDAHPAGTAVLFSWNLTEELLPRLRGRAQQVFVPFPEPRLIEL